MAHGGQRTLLGSLPLALHAGADFPALLRRTMGLGEDVDPPPYRAGVRCRDVVGDTRWLLRVLRTGERPRVRALLEWFAAFSPAVRHYHFAFDDVRPALAGTWFRVRKGCARLFGGRRS